jgi:hypothetical protein
MMSIILIAIVGLLYQINRQKLNMKECRYMLPLPFPDLWSCTLLIILDKVSIQRETPKIVLFAKTSEQNCSRKTGVIDNSSLLDTVFLFNILQRGVFMVILSWCTISYSVMRVMLGFKNPIRTETNKGPFRNTPDMAS